MPLKPLTLSLLSKLNGTDQMQIFTPMEVLCPDLLLFLLNFYSRLYLSFQIVHKFTPSNLYHCHFSVHFALSLALELALELLVFVCV